MRIDRMWAGALCGLMCGTVLPVRADDAAAPPAAGPAALETVVVTSQKRKEDVKQVPLSVSVISGSGLAANRIEDYSDISRSLPNVSFTTQAGAGLSNIEVRGISSLAGSATVGVYMDEVSLTTRNLYSQGTAEPRFFDVDRVEVLRGPQGTLFGAGALGGVVRFITRQPDLKERSFDVEAEVSKTSHGGTNYQLQGVGNIPFNDGRMALRLGFQQGHDSGYIDQVDPNTLAVLDKGINGKQWGVLKLALKTQLTPDWSATAAVFNQDYEMKDIDASYLSVGAYQLLLPSDALTAGLQPFQTSKFVREPGTDHLTIPSLTLNGDLGFADLTAVGSLFYRTFNRIQDGVEVNSSYIGSQITNPGLASVVSLLPSQVLLNNSIRQESLEVRLASKSYVPGGLPLTWIAGGFYARTRTQVIDNEPVFGINAAFSRFGVDIGDPAQLADSFPGAFPNDNSYFSARHYDDRQYSLFGEATYHFSESLRLTGGLRFLIANQRFKREGDFYFAGGPAAVDIESHTSSTTPRIALDWDIDKSTTLYANIAKGFRLGSANRPIPDIQGVRDDLKALGLSGFPATFGPDSLVSYEVGSKSRLWDNRVALNLAAFFINWQDIQQDVTLPTTGYDFETNTGRAHSMGVEGEVRARVLSDLTITAGAGFTRAVFAEDVPSLGFFNNDPTQLHVRKGDRIEGVPRYNANLGAAYEFPVGAAGGVARVNGHWTGSSNGSLIRTDTDYERPGYFTADASLGLLFDKFELNFFVKNLTNEDKVLQQPSIQFVAEAVRLTPRTVGVTASASF